MIKSRDSHRLKLWRLPVLLLVVLTLMMLAPSPVQAQTVLEKYYGGSGDGFTLLTSDEMTLDGSIPVNSARYYGGSGDGFTLLTSDEVTLDGTIPVNSARYYGGSGDGFTLLASDEMTLDGSIIVNSARYYSGSGDGFTVLTSNELPLSEPNQVPIVTAVALYESNRTTTATSMTPQLEYAIKVAVTDLDQLFDLSTVTVTLYYDADGTYNAGEVPGTGNTQTAAILTLTVGGTPVWAIDPSASTTWTIEGGSSTQPTLTNNSGYFWFHFKPGKVATETADPAKWHIHAVADDGEDTDAGYQDNRGINWYGEVVTNTTDVTWTDIPPGEDFGASTKQTGISLTYIANSDYIEEAAASSTWTGTSNTATLNAGGTPGAGEFSLKINDEDVLGTALLLQATPTYVTIDDTGTQTGESGDTVTTNTLWLKTGTPFPSDNYSGTIYHSIAP